MLSVPNSRSKTFVIRDIFLLFWFHTKLIVYSTGIFVVQCSFSIQFLVFGHKKWLSLNLPLLSCLINRKKTNQQPKWKWQGEMQDWDEGALRHNTVSLNWTCKCTSLLKFGMSVCSCGLRLLPICKRWSPSRIFGILSYPARLAVLFSRAAEFKYF